MAAVVVTKVACGAGEEKFKAIIGSDSDSISLRHNIVEVIVHKDRYDAMSGGEQTNIGNVTLSSIISAAYTGG